MDIIIAIILSVVYIIFIIKTLNSFIHGNYRTNIFRTKREANCLLNRDDILDEEKETLNKGSLVSFVFFFLILLIKNNNLQLTIITIQIVIALILYNTLNILTLKRTKNYAIIKHTIALNILFLFIYIVIFIFIKMI